MTKAEDRVNQEEEYKFWAFISYSHTDESWAKWLHKSLETYSVPRNLAGRKTSKHGQLPRRVFPVFRDRDELPGAADLGGKITSALRQSRNLIVICSPAAAGSKWVNEEIKSYKALGRDDRVLCLIVDGEPNVSDEPQGDLQECFPEAIRFRVDPNRQLLLERTEPIAADAREGKDGKFNAKLKLLAGVLDVGYDELRQREKRRIFRRRVYMTFATAGLILFTSLAYLTLADAGLNVPGRERIQTFVDRNDISIMRRAHSLEDIQSAAAPLRRALVDALATGRDADGWIKTNLNPRQAASVEIWSHSQALCGIMKTPELNQQELRSFVPEVDLPFSAGVTIEKDGVKFGWQSHKGEQETIAEPALWTAAALSAALARPGLLSEEERQRFQKDLLYTQETLKLYRPIESGGWNMFPNQRDLRLHNPYTTALALLALLEARKAGSPWEGSTERRDQLLHLTAQWLISQFDKDGQPPGWHGVAESQNQIFDGLTLQIYAELLRAEADAGVELPPEILKEIPAHLIRCADRDLNYPIASGEFSSPMRDYTGREGVGKESIGFLWYPWAIDGSVRWLQRAERHGASKEEQVRVRRTLGHLVVDLGPEAVHKARTDWVFIVAELLYGFSGVPESNKR